MRQILRVGKRDKLGGEEKKEGQRGSLDENG